MPKNLSLQSFTVNISLVPRAHIRIDGDAVVGGVSEFVLGDLGGGVGGEEESVGARAGLGQRVFDFAPIGADVHRGRKTPTPRHETEEARTIFVRESLESGDRQGEEEEVVEEGERRKRRKRMGMRKRKGRKRKRKMEM